METESAAKRCKRAVESVPVYHVTIPVPVGPELLGKYINEFQAPKYSTVDSILLKGVECARTVNWKNGSLELAGFFMNPRPNHHPIEKVIVDFTDAQEVLHVTDLHEILVVVYEKTKGLAILELKNFTLHCGGFAAMDTEVNVNDVAKLLLKINAAHLIFSGVTVRPFFRAQSIFSGLKPTDEVNAITVKNSFNTNFSDIYQLARLPAKKLCLSGCAYFDLTNFIEKGLLEYEVKVRESEMFQNPVGTIIPKNNFLEELYVTNISGYMGVRFIGERVLKVFESLKGNSKARVMKFDLTGGRSSEDVSTYTQTVLNKIKDAMEKLVDPDHGGNQVIQFMECLPVEPSSATKYYLFLNRGGRTLHSKKSHAAASRMALAKYTNEPSVCLWLIKNSINTLFHAGK